MRRQGKVLAFNAAAALESLGILPKLSRMVMAIMPNDMGRCTPKGTGGGKVLAAVAAAVKAGSLHAESTFKEVRARDGPAACSVTASGQPACTTQCIPLQGCVGCRGIGLGMNDAPNQSPPNQPPCCLPLCPPVCCPPPPAAPVQMFDVLAPGLHIPGGTYSDVLERYFYITSAPFADAEGNVHWPPPPPEVLQLPQAEQEAMRLRIFGPPINLSPANMLEVMQGALEGPRGRLLCAERLRLGGGGRVQHPSAAA